MSKEIDNLDENARLELGYGIFSNKQLFPSDEAEELAAQEYFENATTAFEESLEAKEIVSSGRELGFVHSFVELAYSYNSITVDLMTRGDVCEVLLELYPRKLSIEITKCDDVINEIAAFWRFVSRVYRLESAVKFEAEVRSMRADFIEEMSDPNNYGLAKSFIMQGMAAGFDMTTEEGLQEAQAAYNNGLDSSRGHQPDTRQSTTNRVDPAESPFAGMSLKQRKKMLSKKKKY